ncbi:hypothetical protein J3R30DRAFT_3702107 [Lentinula aciculospora]|uniref:Uncharacterized protein n=1 Tax=Lentinula aciculospora TaxID=153920 RepID=A0A9W9ABR4_9AGAR|nr:hypothetical protein J3R30DRAFT_3702107 [Lentinula aciculospora]
MEGHRKGDCDGPNTGYESDSRVRSDSRDSSDGEKKDTTCIKNPSESLSRVTRASSRAARRGSQVEETAPAISEHQPLTIEPSTGTPPKQKTNSKSGTKKRLAASRDGRETFDPDVLTSQVDNSSSIDQEQKPIVTASNTKHSKAETLLSSVVSAAKDEELDNLPSPKALIYASSDFLELGDAGAAIRNEMLKNAEGKDYHAGVFYTPTVIPDSKSYALADSQSVLRSRAPGAFIVGGELEIVEGPKMVTIPQLVLGSCVAVVLLIYVLSEL